MSSDCGAPAANDRTASVTAFTMALVGSTGGSTQDGLQPRLREQFVIFVRRFSDTIGVEINRVAQRERQLTGFIG